MAQEYHKAAWRERLVLYCFFGFYGLCFLLVPLSCWDIARSNREARARRARQDAAWSQTTNSAGYQEAQRNVEDAARRKHTAEREQLAALENLGEAMRTNAPR